MNKFWVGQRVKKVRGVQNHGCTGVITKMGAPWPMNKRGYDAFIVSDMPWQSVTSGNPNSMMRPAGTGGYAMLKDWEPILPDGLESIEEIEELYLAPELEEELVP